MNDFVIPRPARYAAGPSAPGGTSLFALGLWVRLGFIGACLVLSSLVSIADTDTALGTVLALGVTGTVLTLIAWLRVGKAFRDDRFESAMAQRSLP